MRKVGSFIFSIVALLLTTGMLVFGVIAAQTTSFSLNNSILYTPTSAYVNILAIVDGADESKLNELERQELRRVFMTDTTSPNPDTDLGTWTLPTLNFISRDNAIIFTFNIKNIGEKDITADIILTSTVPANTIDRQIEKYFGDLGSDGLTIDLENPGNNELITNKWESSDPLVIHKDETAALRLVIQVSETCQGNFENIANNFKVVITEV